MKQSTSHTSSGTHQKSSSSRKYRSGNTDLGPPHPDIPHCPNPDCTHFTHPPITTDWCLPFGTYRTSTFGTVKRYRCCTCKKTFSTQTFSIDYYVKRRVDYPFLIESLCTSRGLSNTARFLGLRVELLQNRYERVARVALALHGSLRAQLSIPSNERFVLDGLESFSESQYFPNNINILANRSCEFIYSMGLSVLGRKGRMTDAQKRKVARLKAQGRHPSSSQTKTSVQLLLKDLLGILVHEEGHLYHLYSDRHHGYVQAVKRIHSQEYRFHHLRIPSQLRRDQWNPLFAVNYIDRQIRKDRSDHRRETVEFARCPSAMMARLAVYMWYHNYLICWRVKEERSHQHRTRGMLMGLDEQVLDEHIIQKFRQRPFLHKASLWSQERKTWLLQWQNPGKEVGRYIPKYIAA
jgi:transposase-like protein